MGSIVSTSENESEYEFDEKSSNEASGSSSSSSSGDDFLFGSDDSSDDDIYKGEEKQGINYQGILFGVGNPLLNIFGNVGKGYLKKYDLKLNDAILAEEKHKCLYNDLVEMFPVDYVAGGSTQNSIKVAQWMLNKQGSTIFVGCIGEDKFGDILKEKMEESGVKTAYFMQSEEPTGLCASLLCGTDKSLCVNLAAANKYKLSHLQKEENWKLVEQAHYYYIAGFFLTVSPETIQCLAKHAAHDGKNFMMNLSAPFLCEFFMKPLMDIMPYIDILFGNKTEALAFAEMQKFDTTDVEEIARKIASLPKINSTKSRIVVITQGNQDTIVVNGPHNVTTYPIISLDESKIVDHNGVGDAFVGGFLSQLVQGFSISKCVDGGHFVANVVIQRFGCTTPEKCTF